jgi:hypothetical protein
MEFLVFTNNLVMKRLLTILSILGFVSGSLKAPESKTVLIPYSEGVKPLEPIWNAICEVESSNNPFAIGDKNLKEYSYGIAQIRRSRLDDYYRQTGIRYYEKDAFDVEKSKEIFLFYASQCHYTEVEKIARLWNGGSKGMQKKSTKRYFLKVKQNL